MSRGWSDSRFCRLVGLPEAKRQLSQLPEVVRFAAAHPLSASVDAIAAAARASAPRRSPENALPGYSGGALADRIAGRVSTRHLIGIVGIEKGAIVVVRGRAHKVKAKSVKYRRLRKDGTYVTARRQRFVSEASRAKLQQRGGLVVQPTKYGHLMEFSARSFLRPAVRRQQSTFESGMREMAPDVINLLRSRGSGGGA